MSASSSPEAELSEDVLAQAQEIQTRIEMGDASVVPLLLRRIRASGDKVLRRLLARAASGLATSEHLRPMAKLYMDEDAHLRLWALATVTRLEDHRFYPLVVRGYVFDPDKRVRSACRRALRRLSPSQRGRLLEHMLGAEKSWMRESASLARNLLETLDQDSMHAGSASMDLDLSMLGEAADLGPRGDYEPEPEEPESADGPEEAVDEGALEDLWRRKREQRQREMGIAEAIRKDGRDSSDQRTFSRKDCPECGERIMVEAVLCRYCHAVFDADALGEIQELAKVKVVPLPIRSPSHRGSALVVDLLISALLLPLAGLGLVYFLLKDAIRDGQSLGKRVYNLRVVDVEQGTPCTPKQSLMRNALLLIPFLPLVEVVLLAARGTRLGDQAAETRVVFSDDPPATAILAAATMAMAALLALSMVAVLGARRGFLG